MLDCNKLLFCVLALLAFFPMKSFARERFVPSNIGTVEQAEQPWFTGPLLASGTTTIPVGHVNIQPYFFATKFPAFYNNHWKAKTIPTFWSLSTVVPVWIGLTQWMDVQIQPQWSWNHESNVGGHWALGDLAVQVEFQLYRDTFPAQSWIPSMKFAVREYFPTGRYQHLSPDKKAVEQGGLGSYATSFIFALGRIVHLSGLHYISLRWNGIYTIFTPVHVKGFNSYGGGFGTDGTVHLRPNFLSDFGMEISLTKHWAFALDLVGEWRGGNSFSGQNGFLEERQISAKQNTQIASNSSLSSIRYSIAPAIEYNFNASLGIIAGPWFTVAGKNTTKFYSGIISVNYYK